MNLRQMLEAFDEVSLEAVSSKGVIRRAKRDLSLSAHRVIEASDAQAKLSTDGQIVTLTPLGPTKALCTCPATGVCRHIVLSVLALKEYPDFLQEEGSVTSVPILESAKAQVLQLTEVQLKKYAGADWDQALVVADAYEVIDVSEHGLNCTLSIDDELVKVTLISGQSIKESVFKGPKTKQRLLTTVCLILLRKQSGIAVIQPKDANDVVHSTPIDFEFLNAAKKEVLRSVGAVLNGTPEIAVNRLYDLAISARLASAPRVVSQLRSLAKLASLSTTRHVQFQPSTYIRASANTYFLLLALEKAPSDFALTGVLRREFLNADPLELWVLGATKWRTPNGARGLTAYGFSSQTKQWYSIANARAAGSDPLFSPMSVYHSQIWNAGLLADLIGGSVLLNQPRISADNQISLTLEVPGKDLNARISWEQLVESGACHRNIADLKEYLSETLSSGIRRASAPKPFLFTPTSYTAPYFNDIDQTYYWGLLDNCGNRIELQFSGEQSTLINDLVSLQYKIKALLVTAEYGTEYVMYKLCSVLSDEKGALTVFNVSFDKMVHSKTVFEKIKSSISLYRSSEHSFEVDPISLLSESVVDACIKSSTSKLSTEECQVFVRKAETLGLGYLANALKKMQTTNDLEATLKTVYIASEVQLLASTS